MDLDEDGVVDGLDQSYLYSHWGEVLPSEDALVTFARLESLRSPLASVLNAFRHQSDRHDTAYRRRT